MTVPENPEAQRCGHGLPFYSLNGGRPYHAVYDYAAGCTRYDSCDSPPASPPVPEPALPEPVDGVRPYGPSRPGHAVCADGLYVVESERSHTGWLHYVVGGDWIPCPAPSPAPREAALPEHRITSIWQERIGEDFSWRCLCGYTTKHARPNGPIQLGVMVPPCPNDESAVHDA